MAQTLKAPSAHLLRHLRHQQWQWHRPIAVQPTRQFSVSRPRNATKSVKAADMSMPKMPAQPSMKSLAKKEMTGRTAKEVPKDFGIFPMTLIFPSRSTRRENGRNKGALQRSRDFTLLLWTWLRTRVTDWVGTNYVYKRRVYPHKDRRQRPKIAARKIPATARTLHKQLFSAFAAGSAPRIAKIAGESLAASLAARISHREVGARLHWSVVRDVRRPRLVSQKAAELPFLVDGEKAGARQAVVRVETEQRVVAGRTLAEGERGESDFWSDKSGDGVEWGVPKVKTVVEYLVLQRRMIKGVEEPWCIVGFARETTADDIRQWKIGVFGSGGLSESEVEGAPVGAAPAV